MNRYKIILAILALAVVIIVAAPLVVNPLLKKQLLGTLHQKYPDYDITIDKVRWRLIPSQLTLSRITVTSRSPQEDKRYLKGEVEEIRFKGIRNIKALFKREYEIREIIVSNSNIEGKIPFHKKEKIPLTSTVNVQIDQILFDQINLSLEDSSSLQTFVVKEGVLRLKNLDIQKKDTLGILHSFDLSAATVLSNTPDSMYTYQADGVVYTDSLQMLSVDSFLLKPNFNKSDFMAKHPYETDRFTVKISDLRLHHFQGEDLYNSGHLVSSSLSMGFLNLEAFRDKRKKDSQEKKPVFQQYLYEYPGLLRIDSMIINDGKITYIEHAEKASEPGSVYLNAFKTRVYNITNDTIYKTKDSSLTIIAEAMLMGKGKMNLLLKAKLYDPVHTFSLDGSLAPMKVKELNPILEKNAFIYTNTARVNRLKFNFTANDKKASGQLVMLYDGLDLTVKNKHTNDTSGIKEQIITLIANKSTWDSNPMPKEEARVGTIDYERDPTKFVFNYCIKSILSGIKSTIIKHPKTKKSLLQRIFTRADDPQKDSAKK